MAMAMKAWTAVVAWTTAPRVLFGQIHFEIWTILWTKAFWTLVRSDQNDIVHHKFSISCPCEPCHACSRTGLLSRTPPMFWGCRYQQTDGIKLIRSTAEVPKSCLASLLPIIKLNLWKYSFKQVWISAEPDPVPGLTMSKRILQLQFWNFCFVFWTNLFCNLDKYVLQFG